MKKSPRSPNLDNLFPEDEDAQEFVNNLALTSHLDQALHQHGGHPFLSELIRAKASQSRLLEAVHDLADEEPEWAKNSEKLRQMFPRA